MSTTYKDTAGRTIKRCFNMRFYWFAGAILAKLSFASALSVPRFQKRLSFQDKEILTWKIGRTGRCGAFFWVL